MKRKTINAVEGIEMLMSFEVEIQTNELAITIHEKGSSVHTILVWGTIDCINEIRDYLSENCDNASFVDKGKGFCSSDFIGIEHIKSCCRYWNEDLLSWSRFCN